MLFSASDVQDSWALELAPCALSDHVPKDLRLKGTVSSTLGLDLVLTRNVRNKLWDWTCLIIQISIRQTITRRFWKFTNLDMLSQQVRNIFPQTQNSEKDFLYLNTETSDEIWSFYCKKKISCHAGCSWVEVLLPFASQSALSWARRAHSLTHAPCWSLLFREFCHPMLSETWKYFVAQNFEYRSRWEVSLGEHTLSLLKGFEVPFINWWFH